MDCPQQSVGNFRHLGRKFHPHPVAQHQLRTCLARAQRGRGYGRVFSAWAWPGPLSWGDNKAKPAENSSPPSTKGPIPAQQALAGQREFPSDSGGPPNMNSNKNNRAGNTGATTNATASGQSRGLGPASTQPTAGPDLQVPGKSRTGAAGLQDKTIVTFAYGANMNFLTLARREVRVVSRDPAFVVNPAVRLVFKHQGGYATLERVEGGGTAEGKEEPRFRPYDGRVHGVLYRVTEEDFEKLSKREGGYVVQEVQVQTYDGVQHTALAFVSNPLFKLPQEVTPTEKYLARVREGARDNYLDPTYQAFLSGISTVPGTGLGAEYYNTPSKYMGYSFLVVVALITFAFFFQH